MRVILIYLIFWLALMVIAIGNGILREATYGQQLSELRAHQLSTLTAGVGHLSTMKFRVVCKTCNNGWMNELEIAAKPILTKLMEGHQFQLDENDQRILSEWIVMKSLVAEHSQPDTCMTPAEDRARFLDTREIPEYFNVLIGMHDTNADSGYVRHSATLAKSASGPQPPLAGLQRNTQSITFLCGRLVVFVVAVRVYNLNVSSYLQNSAPGVTRLVRIYPHFEGLISWPLPNVCEDGDLFQLAYWLDSLATQPNIGYVDKLPDTHGKAE